MSDLHDERRETTTCPECGRPVFRYVTTTNRRFMPETVATSWIHELVNTYACKQDIPTDG